MPDTSAPAASGAPDEGTAPGALLGVRVGSGRGTALAALMLVGMVCLELRTAGGPPPFPLYYLLPISLLAWFGGFGQALAAAAAAFLVTLVPFLGMGVQPATVAGAIPLRLITFSLGVLLARPTRTARLMVEFYRRGPDWRASLRPLRVGSRLLVVPVRGPPEPQLQAAIPEGLIPVYIEPGLAFGSSSHPTTRMCLDLLEQHLRPPASVLDIGCGTGILAIAAARMGAARVHAIDIDPSAVRLARTNVAHNGLSDRVNVEEGTVEAAFAEDLRLSASPRPPLGSPGFQGARFDLILANVHAPVVEGLLRSGIARLLAAGGMLIASGIRNEELPSIEARASGSGLVLSESVSRNGWSAVVARAAPAGDP